MVALLEIGVALVVAGWVVIGMKWWRALPEEKRQEHRDNWRDSNDRAKERRAERAKRMAAAQADRAKAGTIGSRRPISQVGDRTAGGLACPRCGGSQFTAKRSNTGKVIGFTTLGVGGLIAPKSQVKCVTCGAMFKRG